MYQFSTCLISISSSSQSNYSYRAEMPEVAMERRRTCGCPRKGLLFLFLLLIRLYTSCAIYERRSGHLKTQREDLLEKIKYVKQNVLRLAKYSGKEKVEMELEMNHVLSSLLEMGNLITDKEQLEMFQNELEAVVNVVEQQRFDDRQLFLVETKKIYAIYQEGKKNLKRQMSTLKLHPSLECNVVFHNVMQILEDSKKYLTLRFWSFTAEPEDIERILKIYHVSEFEHNYKNLDFYISESDDEAEEDLDFYASKDKPEEDLDFYVSEDKPEEDLDFYVSEDKPEEDLDFYGSEDEPEDDLDFYVSEDKPEEDLDFYGSESEYEFHEEL